MCDQNPLEKPEARLREGWDNNTKVTNQLHFIMEAKEGRRRGSKEQGMLKCYQK